MKAHLLSVIFALALAAMTLAPIAAAGIGHP